MICSFVVVFTEVHRILEAIPILDELKLSLFFTSLKWMNIIGRIIMKNVRICYISLFLLTGLLYNLELFPFLMEQFTMTTVRQVNITPRRVQVKLEPSKRFAIVKICDKFTKNCKSKLYYVIIVRQEVLCYVILIWSFLSTERQNIIMDILTFIFK